MSALPDSSSTLRSYETAGGFYIGDRVEVERIFKQPHTATVTGRAGAADELVAIECDRNAIPANVRPEWLTRIED